MLTYLAYFCLALAIVLVGFALFGVLHVGHLLAVVFILLVLTVLFLAWPASRPRAG